ncbi:KRAB-A domain-containing protein 2-like [Mytilus edulis]|uniref:KRAB-A domain-containing protein 2-like n=1 Tax=Mytilus edulis TaxID=6550 RepID=UPI0039EEB8A8
MAEGFERGNADIKDMLVIWMRENNSKKWNIGLKFVQFEKNNSHHSGINRSPYKAMFGCDAKIGLSSSSLPQEILGSLQTEEDLIQHFQSSDKPNEISNDRPNELSSDKPNELDEESQLNAALNLSETQETELDVHMCAVCENLFFEYPVFDLCAVCT